MLGYQEARPIGNGILKPTLLETSSYVTTACWRFTSLMKESMCWPTQRDSEIIIGRRRQPSRRLGLRPLRCQPSRRLCLRPLRCQPSRRLCLRPLRCRLSTYKPVTVVYEVPRNASLQPIANSVSITTSEMCNNVSCTTRDRRGGVWWGGVVAATRYSRTYVCSQVYCPLDVRVRYKYVKLLRVNQLDEIIQVEKTYEIAG